MPSVARFVALTGADYWKMFNEKGGHNYDKIIKKNDYNVTRGYMLSWNSCRLLK